MHDHSLPAGGSTPALMGPAAILTKAAPGEREALVRLGGILYGALFALIFVAACWGYDALQLYNAGASLPWSKLLVGTAPVLLVCVLAGWLATLSDRIWFRALVWAAANIAIAAVAAHAVYEGSSLLVALADPYPAARTAYPFPDIGTGRMIFGMVVGTFLGIFAGMLHGGAAEAAWEGARPGPRGYSFSPGSLFSILIRCLPLALVFALSVDSMNNAIWRTTMLDMPVAFDIARDPAQDLKQYNLSSLAPFRARLGAHPALYMVHFDPNPDDGTSTVDALFENGLMLRCQYVNQTEFLTATGRIPFCFDAGSEAHDALTQLFTLGHLTCGGCSVLVDYDVRRWAASALPALGALQDVALLQHEGPWFYERATFAGGRAVDCRLSGASPIVVDLCVPVR